MAIVKEIPVVDDFAVLLEKFERRDQIRAERKFKKYQSDLRKNKKPALVTPVKN